MIDTKRVRRALRLYEEIYTGIPKPEDANQVHVSIEDFGVVKLSPTTRRMICEEVAAKRSAEIFGAEQELIEACKELSHARSN